VQAIAALEEAESQRKADLGRTAEIDSAANLGARSELLGRTLSSMVFLPVTRRTVAGEDRTSAHFDLARVALALAAYRAAEGDFPASLASLREKHHDPVPGDSLAGGDLSFRRRGKGYVLYSRGLNGTDDTAAKLPAEPGAGEEHRVFPEGFEDDQVVITVR
jgi:hypothetical protein